VAGQSSKQCIIFTVFQGTAKGNVTVQGFNGAMWYIQEVKNSNKEDNFFLGCDAM
jgi:hypothetical protein